MSITGLLCVVFTTSPVLNIAIIDVYVTHTERLKSQVHLHTRGGCNHIDTSSVQVRFALVLDVSPRVQF